MSMLKRGEQPVRRKSSPVQLIAAALPGLHVTQDRRLFVNKGFRLRRRTANLIFVARICGSGFIGHEGAKAPSATRGSLA